MGKVCRAIYLSWCRVNSQAQFHSCIFSLNSPGAGKNDMSESKRIFCKITSIFKWMYLDCSHACTPCFYAFMEGVALLSVPSALHLALPFIHRWKVLTAVPLLHELPRSTEIMEKCNNWGGAVRTIPPIVCRTFQFLGWILVGGPNPKVIPMIYWTEDICAISLIVSLTGPLSQQVQDQNSKRWKYQLLKFSRSWKTKDSGGLPSNLTEESIYCSECIESNLLELNPAN